MGKKKKKAEPVVMRQKEQTMVINMREVQRKAAPYSPPSFRGGAHMTEKDRPRQKRFSVDDY